MLEDFNTRKGRGCWPKNDPYSQDPAVWAVAYLRSLDWLRPIKTYRWFTNAMATGLDDLTHDDQGE